jgi:KDO2-lipid IV(A) lauroyltransferase
MPSTLLGKAWLRVRWRIAYLISRFGFRVGPYLPTRLCYAVSVPIADLCFLILSRHRRNLIANLARVVSEDKAEAAARRTFRNYGRYIVDLYQLPSLGRNVLDQRIKFHDWQTLDAALDESPSTIFVTLHLGQAELGGAALSTYRHPISVIAEPLEYGPMNEFVQGLRRSIGMKIIPAKKSKLGILRALNRGEVLATMFDVVEEDESVCVDLFGRPALVSSAPARLALRTGARVLPAVVSRDTADKTKLVPSIDFDLCFEASGDEDADVRALSQAIARSLERFIARYPDQWFAFRPVWSKEAENSVNGLLETRSRTERWMEWSLRLAARFGHRMPRPLAYSLARLAGDLAFYLRPSARADVEDNMRHVMGANATAASLRRYTKEAFRNVARYYVDLVRIPESREDFIQSIRLHNLDRLTRPLEQGRGVVVATAHVGNPEMAVQTSAVLGIDVLVLAEPLQPPSFARLMMELRSDYGARYEDVSFSAVANAIRHLRKGGCLAITCDRDIQGKGVPVPFFDVPAKLPLGAADLAARTGALLLPGYCRRSGDKFDIFFEEPLDLVNTGNDRDDALTNAKALLGRAERWIREDPGQWMPLERIWKPLETMPERSKSAAGKD